MKNIITVTLEKAKCLFLHFLTSQTTSSLSYVQFFRYMLPALSHLSAEDAPRKVLLTLETPALLVDFLSQSWDSLKGSSKVALTTAYSMTTACCTLLNFTVTEPERVRYTHAPSHSLLL